MPNSGVFYNGGKFHISKLSTDLVQFAGQVEATGIALADNQETGSTLPGAATSIILPTATQVVDYVQQTVTAGAEYDLAAGSASSLESSFAYNAQLADDGAGTVKTEKERLDDMFAEFAELIADAAEESEVRDNTMQNAIAFIDADGTYLNAKLGATSIASQTAVQAFSFPAPAQSTLKADMESRFGAIHSAFDSLAKASEDADDAIEASVGLDGSNGAYIAPTWTGGALQVWDVTANSNAGGFVAYSGSEITAATTVKNADELLRAMIKENNDAFTTLMAGTGVDFDTLKDIVDTYKLADTEVVDAVTKMAARIGLTISGLNDGVANNEVVTLADLAAVVDASANASARGLAAIAYNLTTMPSLKAMVEQSRSDISAHLVAMQTEMDSIETGAGLEANGSYVAPTGVQYLLAASSLKDADMKLDAEIKVVNERLSDKHGVESLLDFNSFDSDGASLPVPAARTADFALSAGYNVVDALNELAQGASSSISDLQDELDRTQASIGFDLLGTNTDGSDYSPAFAASANGYFGTGASLMAVVGDARTAADVAFKGFEGGTGLGKDGVYTANGAANYISTATSLQDADNKLDAALKVEELARIAADSAIQAELDATQTALGASISAAGLYVPHSGKNYINGNADLTEDIVALDAKMKIEADSLDASQADIFASGGTLAADFTINGNAYATIEGAINAISGSLGDSDIDFSADSGTGSVDLATEVMAITSASTGNILQAPATNLITEASAQSLTIKMKPEIQVDEVRAQFVQSAVVGSSMSVQHAPFVADEAMDSGAIVCVQKGGTRKYGIENADIGDSAKIEILGMAFDPASTNGGITAHTFTAGDAVAIVKSGQNVEGVSFAAADQDGTALTYAVGDALYLGVDNSGNNVITKAIPSDDGAIPFDAKAVISLGFVSAKSGTNGATADAMWFEVKLVAMEA